MVIKRVTGVCPGCGENISIDFSEAEIYIQAEEPCIAFECPKCGAEVDEQMEQG